ncbi:tetratricopeptide repeat protein [uncultured Neptuniibacter sp.]|uniref:tetratricopeptide repeat protein n=1 Tax=uncultured Neptuniibacter sp. TaxID=502143 RepID=UPI00261A7DA6|nr:tetratricopeptide repeat protein [uncultured Neptuniibacter sp.]
MVQVRGGLKAAVAGVMFVGLAGCVSGTGGYRPPVEDRTGQGGVVQQVEPAATGVVVRPGVIRESRTEQTVSVPVPTARTVQAQNPAVIALLDSAKRQKQSGSMQSAESSLERAQRIAPRDPEIYYHWADLRRLEGRWPQAEQLALKGTNLAIGDVVMLRRLWLLIADIRQSSGDRSGAREARLKAQSY